MCVMNISLTWANFALITGLCLAGYYIVVGLVYNRKNINHLLYPKRKQYSFDIWSQPHFEDESASSVSSNIPEDKTLEEVLPINDTSQLAPSPIQDFIDEIEAYTLACNMEDSKEELLKNIGKILQKYPSLMNSSLQYLLTEMIAMSCRNNCSIHLSVDELNDLWNG